VVGSDLCLPQRETGVMLCTVNSTSDYTLWTLYALISRALASCYVCKFKVTYSVSYGKMYSKLIHSVLGTDMQQQHVKGGLNLIIIIISAERRPLLDIGLPQSSPPRSVLCCPHPATSRDLHQIVGPPCGGAYQRCVSRYEVAIRGPFRPKGIYIHHHHHQPITVHCWT
jgi:hypothetical protein